MPAPLVTAIVSTYDAERFFRGCIEDLLAQSIGDALEIIVIDSGSPGGEASVCREFMQTHANIRYVRTQREPLYTAWNRAVAIAAGKYLTSANTDDRHRPDAFERLVDALEHDGDAVLAYGDQYESRVANEDFATCQARSAPLRQWPDFTADDLLLRCITGSQPLWRRDLHARHGLFDTSLGIAADYEFWLRIAQHHRLLHVPQALGMLFVAADTLSGTGNRLQADTEKLAVQLRYLPCPPWERRRELRRRLAREVFGTGYFYIERERSATKAMPFLRAAWRLDPTNLSYAKTVVLRTLLGAR